MYYAKLVNIMSIIRSNRLKLILLGIKGESVILLLTLTDPLMGMDRPIQKIKDIGIS